MIKTSQRRIALLENKNVFNGGASTCFNFFGCGLDFFNEFRSPKINSSNFFYGQLTCISIDIQNLFSFYCFHLCPKKCMHTHSSGTEKRTKNGSSSRSSIKFSHKNCVLIVSLRTTRNEKGRKKCSP